MLKSGGEYGTSFLNSRKAKWVFSAFHIGKMASKFQEMGGVLGFLPRKFFFFPQNSDSVGRKLFSFPCNFFFVRRNFENVRQNRLRLRRMQIFFPKIIEWRQQSR